MSPARLLLIMLIMVAALSAAAHSSSQSVPKLQSVGTLSPLSGVGNPTAYSVPDRGAVTYNTLGSGSTVNVGYARVQPNTGSTAPAGYLTFSYRTNGVLVSEASVPISTTASARIAVIGLRGEYNERSDFLITTSMPASEATPPSSAEAFFPHLADGGGYTTEFVLFSGSPGQAPSGLLRFFTQSGAPSN